MIECVVTCVGYGDFLAATLPFNRHVFDHLIVVTAPDDGETIRVCEYYDVECLTTHAFTEGGSSFNKGRAINAGLSLLKQTGRVVHLDADIVLPPKARAVLHGPAIDPKVLYGVDRVTCHTYEEWCRFLRLPALHHQLDVVIHQPPFEPSARVARSVFNGYLPIGYFQLWTPSACGRPRYPETHTDAARSDVGFAAQWPRQERGLIPELYAIHLESERAEIGANWAGRTTKAFGPKPLEWVTREFDPTASRWALHYEGPAAAPGGAA